MQYPTIPTNESARLRNLYSYQLLDTLPEQSYNDLVSIAANICNTPISLVSLVDKDRCWFKAKLGLDQSEAPRKIAYAAHAINQPDEIMVIEDALKDERFFDCPLVLDDPPMRFYAGTPLVSDDGFALGTLCVIDKVPRQLTAEQIQTLKKLANQIVAQFELRKKMLEIEQLNNQLNTAYQEMESFSYSVAHDLKAPLKGMQGYIQLLQEEYIGQLDEDAQEMFKEVTASTNKMEDLVADILHLSKVTRDTLQLKIINLTDLCLAIIHNLMLPDNYIIKVAPNLSAYGDERLIKTALTNLIGNAVKYSSKVARPTIEISQTCYEDQSVFFIKDNGVGFDMSTAANIFKPFSRLHGASEFEGSGVGLAIVDRIIKRHNGHIWVESKLGKGACFYFSIA